MAKRAIRSVPPTRGGSAPLRDSSEGDLNVSPRRRAWTRKIGPAARKMLAEDAKYFLHQGLSTPCLDALTGCRGAELVARDGRRLLDFHGNSLHQVGHANPRVLTAVRRQLREMAFSPRRFANLTATRLARKLTELAPGDLNRVLFAPGGTAAIGMALKLARAATGRHKTVSLWDSFHGASLDAISIGGEAIFRRDIGPLLPGCEHAPPPDPSRCVFGCGAACDLRCAGYIEYILEKEGDIAAVIAETVRATPHIPPPGYWKKIRAACDKHGALLILDEIPTCLGRTGKMFAFEHFGIVPDMVCVGKGLGGGVMPLAALIAREGLNRAHPDRALGHYTHEKSPVACAAALAVVAEIEERDLLARARELGVRALSRLRATAEKFSAMGEARGLGLLLGVPVARPGASAEENAATADQVMYAALERGLNFKTMGNVLTLVPPLTVSRRQLDKALDIVESCVAEISSAPAKGRRRK